MVLKLGVSENHLEIFKKSRKGFQKKKKKKKKKPKANKLKKQIKESK